MNVRDIMTNDVIVASPEDDLQRAAQLMESNDFGILPVGENDRLVGMLTDRDIAIRAVARGLGAELQGARGHDQRRQVRLRRRSDREARRAAWRSCRCGGFP